MYVSVAPHIVGPSTEKQFLKWRCRCGAHTHARSEDRVVAVNITECSVWLCLAEKKKKKKMEKMRI